MRSTNLDGLFLIAAGSVPTFWHNVLMQSDGWFNYCLNIYWSLSVEEVFYLALPVAFLALRHKALFALLCALLIAYAPVYRFQHAENELFWECGYLACFDAIAAGCLTALAAQRWAIRGALASLSQEPTCGASTDIRFMDLPSSPRAQPPTFSRPSTTARPDRQGVNES